MPEFLKVSPSRVVSSAPHSRSGSFKKSTLDVYHTRPRTNSMPNYPVGDNAKVFKPTSMHAFCLVRSFKTTAKGDVENRGDSLKRNCSKHLMSSGSTITDMTKTSQICNYVENENSRPVPWVPSYFTVAFIGSSGVGKSYLTSQLLTSDYVGYDNINVENEEEEKSVSVVLDGEESIMEFVERHELCDLENSQNDAFVVAFSITDYSSYTSATNIVHTLRIKMGIDRPIMLVANKIDLVRQRKVNANVARAFAKKYDCEYVETSAVLNHQVDNLLVSSLQKIRQKLSPHVESKTDYTKMANKKKSPKKVFGFITKLLHIHNHKSTSCNELLVF